MKIEINYNNRTVQGFMYEDDPEPSIVAGFGHYKHVLRTQCQPTNLNAMVLWCHVCTETCRKAIALTAAAA